jgi:hypothetical protein
MKAIDYFVSLLTGVVITEGCNVMVKCEELIGTTSAVYTDVVITVFGPIIEYTCTV